MDDITGLDVNANLFKKISKQVKLKFTEQNKDFFLVDEEVELQVEVKNV